MEIHVASGVGSGPTKLAAFDAALHSAGVANFNLLQLSSVIPPGSKIIENSDKIAEIRGGWGDRLYVVKADYRTSTPGVEAWAGIGWVTDEATGRGLFVEHEGENKEQVERQIEHSLEALMETRKIDWGKIHMHVGGIVCDKDPVCAVVMAVYRAESW
jgi:arginine decarboxylase